MTEKQCKVAALYTAARYENTYCRNSIDTAIQQAGLQLNISLGVFYGQCMQNLMENVVDNADIIVTVDGDSIFSAGHVNRLLSQLVSNDEIDALAAMQARRGMQYPLFTNLAGEECSIEVNPETPFRVGTAHFGLTAIKCEALRKVKKPWFCAMPSSNGRWDRDSDKVDDDVYFWRTWSDQGKSVFVDPGCRIGHMEEMIAYYDDQLNLQHKYPADWHVEKQEKPACDGRKLNIGGGTNPLPGYEICDAKNGSKAYPLDYPDSTFIEVHASHVLEHFGKYEVKYALRDWVRVLKPGGILQVAVPDFDWLMDHRDDKYFESYLFGSQLHENDFHKCMFTEVSLHDLLADCGLIDIKKWPGVRGECSSYPVSLNLQGMKP
jgi:SAM-dependent methyltransferase